MPKKKSTKSKQGERASDDESGSDLQERKCIKRQPDPDLPSKTLTVPQADWVHLYIVEYSSHIGSQGACNSAFEWVRKNLAGPCLDQFHPTLSADQCKRFWPFIEGSLNSWLNNRSHHVNVADPTNLKSEKKAKNAKNLWAADNKELVCTKWTAKCLANLDLINNPGMSRSMVCKMFSALPPGVKTPYDVMSEDLKRAARVKGVVQEKDKEK
ncbi:hypothetical protein FRC06_010785 [Ceratobasidium sp. 370]|nr:hypothetical protein FRC06_010785 [Ceratobasidium sp. 370]